MSSLLLFLSCLGILAGSIGLDPYFPPAGNGLALDLTFFCGMAFSALPVVDRVCLTRATEDDESNN